MTGPRVSFTAVDIPRYVSLGVSSTLPGDARAILIAASKVFSSTFERGQDLARNVAIEAAVQRVRSMYPQFFNKE